MSGAAIPQNHRFQAGVTAQPCCRQVPTHTLSSGSYRRTKVSRVWILFLFAYTRTINLLFASECIQRSQETERDSLVATTSSLTAMGAKYPFKPCLLFKSPPFKRMYISVLLKRLRLPHLKKYKSKTTIFHIPFPCITYFNFSFTTIKHNLTLEFA